MYQTNADQSSENPVPAIAEAPDSGDHRLVIESRFGTIAVAPGRAIEFPRGLLGFGEYHDYALADLADPRLPQFMVLQCLDDHELAFLVMPMDPDNGVIAQPDLDAACEATSIAVADLAVLLVVTVHRTDDGIVVSANLRAPLLIDTANQTGAQHVLPNDSYPVRFPLMDDGS